MQTVVLGSDAARGPFEEVIRRAGADDVEIVDRNGGVVAYLVPAAPPQDECYAAFEQAFLNDKEELLRRQASSSPSRPTAEVLERMRSLGTLPNQSCDTQ